MTHRHQTGIGQSSKPYTDSRSQTSVLRETSCTVPESVNLLCASSSRAEHEHGGSWMPDETMNCRDFAGIDGQRQTKGTEPQDRCRRLLLNWVPRIPFGSQIDSQQGRQQWTGALSSASDSTENRHRRCHQIVTDGTLALSKTASLGLAQPKASSLAAPDRAS